MFEKQTGYFVKTISVGSGQAMKMGEKGEADVLLVHSPDAEKKFMEEGFGVTATWSCITISSSSVLPAIRQRSKRRRQLRMPKENCRNRSTVPVPRRQFRHPRQGRGYWKATGLKPEGQKWYQQTGLGMGQTLNVAAEKNGYTLADRGTYLAFKKNLALVILEEGDPILLNIYHVIEVNPAKWPKVNIAGAKAFSDFMVAKKTQAVISKFGVDKFGSTLFFPDAGKKE